MKIYSKFLSVNLFTLLFFCYIAKAQTENVDSVFDKVEVEASFPGGPEAWSAYISDKLGKRVSDFGDKDYGTCIVKFIVDKNGKISNVEAVTMKDSKLAKFTIKAIEKGPDWIPAQQDGRKVNAYRLQPVTLTPPDK